MLARFGDRLSHVHLSEVDDGSAHTAVGWMARAAFERVAMLISEDVPVILEAVGEPSQIADELRTAREVFGITEVPA